MVFIRWRKGLAAVMLAFAVLAVFNVQPQNAYAEQSYRYEYADTESSTVLEGAGHYFYENHRVWVGLDAEGRAQIYELIAMFGKLDGTRGRR